MASSLSTRALAMVLCIANSASAASSAQSTCSGGPRQHHYDVSVLARDAVGGGRSLISKANGSSDFTYNFNTAWFPPPLHGAHSAYDDGLVVRVVDCNPNHMNCSAFPHQNWANMGGLAVVNASLRRGARGSNSAHNSAHNGDREDHGGGGPESPQFPPLSAAHVTEAAITWAGGTPPLPSDAPEWGAADPRIVYRPSNGHYYSEYLRRLSPYSGHCMRMSHANVPQVPPSECCILLIGSSMPITQHLCTTLRFIPTRNAA